MAILKANVSVKCTSCTIIILLLKYQVAADKVSMSKMVPTFQDV